MHTLEIFDSVLISITMEAASLVESKSGHFAITIHEGILQSFANRSRQWWTSGLSPASYSATNIQDT